jgi:sporulation protein YlmC with PRC-barrel domain
MATHPQLTFTELLKYSVYTMSGKRLGHVSDIEVDSQEMRLERIYVRTVGIPGLFQQALMIHRNQIHAIEKDRIIVDDAIGKVAAAQPVPAGTEGN